MPRRFPIRATLTVGALLPLCVAIAISSLAGLYIINAKIATQAQERSAPTSTPPVRRTATS